MLPADSFNQPESRIRHPIFRQIFEQYLREKNIILDHTIELWSIPTIKNLVKNNVGISYLPTFTVEEELGTGELEAIHTDIGDKTITAVCVHHKNKWLSPLMQLFIDLCVSISA
uniref:LysR substrate-binding domain-containing protein n=1 Tax=Enterocloster aldenensis TaxID=358742 RepID=UPI001F16E945